MSELLISMLRTNTQTENWLTGNSFQGENYSSTVIQLTWLFSALVVCLFYAGSLTSSTSSTPTEPVLMTINQVEEAIELQSKAIGVFLKNTISYYVKESKSGPLLTFKKAMILIDDRNYVECEEMFQEGKLFYVRVIKDLLRVRKQHNFGPVHFVREPLFSVIGAFAFSKRANYYINPFNKVIRNLRESGILWKQQLHDRQSLQPTLTDVICQQETVAKYINFEDVPSLIWLLIIGHSISALVLICEMLRSSRR